jgi:methylase of polypeptide subunit release factors
VAFGQAEAVSRLVSDAGAHVEVHHDLAGIERVVVGRWP